MQGELPFEGEAKENTSLVSRSQRKHCLRDWLPIDKS